MAKQDWIEVNKLFLNESGADVALRRQLDVLKGRLGRDGQEDHPGTIGVMNVNDSPAFFVPPGDGSTEAWEALRKVGTDWLGRPLRERKIYNLSFTHNLVKYEATVGEPRHATKYRMVRGQTDYNSRPQRYDDGPVVVAIFEAAEDEGPFLIFDAGRGSGWNYPQIVGPRDAEGRGRDFSTA